jgi:hypothetical protein
MRIFLAVSLLAAAAAADPEQAPPNAVNAPETAIVAPAPPTTETSPIGRRSVEFALGWPSASIALVQPLSDRATMAPRFEMLYGMEGTTNTRVGFGVAAPLLITAGHVDRWILGLHVDPGVRSYASRFGSGTDVLIGFPVGALLGYQATPEFRLAMVADVQMAAQVTHGGQFDIGPLFGANLAWALDKQITLALDTRFGPLFYSTGADTDLSFRSQLVINYKL